MIEPARFFDGLAGDWAGTNRLWLEPGVLADESPTRGQIRPALDGRFIVHEYQWSMQGEAQQGLALLGHTGERYQMAWLDSFHNGRSMMFLEGGPDPDVRGSWDPGDGPPWGWRTAFELADQDHLVITSWNVSPNGAEDRAVETRYERLRDATCSPSPPSEPR